MLDRHICAMKKFKLIIKKDEIKDIWLFSEPSTLANWLIDEEARYEKLVNSIDVMRINLRPDDKVEIEWMGCHYMYDGNFSLRADYIKLVKASPAPTHLNRKGMIVTGYAGWTVDAMIKLKHGARNSGVIIKRIIEDESEVIMPSNEDIIHNQQINNASKIIMASNLPKV
jgi:hypothetical protein